MKLDGYLLGKTLMHVSSVKMIWFVCLLYVRYYLGRRPVVVVADPDMLRQVMVRDFSSFPNRMVSKTLRYVLQWCNDNRHLYPYSFPPLHRLFALQQSPWVTVCSCWGMNAGRECGASWPRPSVLPRWKRWDKNARIDWAPSRMNRFVTKTFFFFFSSCLQISEAGCKWVHETPHKYLRENMFVW